MSNCLGLSPFCRICGWRQGGRDSWDGTSCKCGHRAPPEPRFAVVRINGNRSDTHAAEDVAAAIELANPDPGDMVEVAFVCARDAGAARLAPVDTWTRWSGRR